jgi:hypothetical protein
MGLDVSHIIGGKNHKVFQIGDDIRLAMAKNHVEKLE